MRMRIGLVGWLGCGFEGCLGRSAEGRTEGRTAGRTDGRTDRQTDCAVMMMGGWNVECESRC